MWVCRAGIKSKALPLFENNSKIYLAWDGFRYDLSTGNNLSDYRKLVEKEKNTNNRTTVSNLGIQLFNFAKNIRIGDYVLIPCHGSRSYHLARLIGEYTYSPDEEFPHSIKVKFFVKNIPADIFPQSVRYSLGAFRTLFKAKHEKFILLKIKEWSDADA